MSLRVESLSAGYQKDVPIITDIDLVAAHGRVTCIIGPNGAGKSTLLKSICNLIPKISGRVFFEDTDITSFETRKIISIGVCYVPQDNQLFPSMTVEDNVMIAAKSIGINSSLARARMEEILTDFFPDLSIYRGTKVHLLSGGLQKMVAIARGLITDAQVFLMDEPSAGLSPKYSSMIYKTIKKMKENEKTILLVDQNIKDSLMISDYCFVLNNGTITASGDADHMLSQLGDIIRGWLT